MFLEGGSEQICSPQRNRLVVAGRKCCCLLGPGVRPRLRLTSGGESSALTPHLNAVRGPPSVFHNFDWIITRANAVKLHVRLSWCLCLRETQTSPPRRGADLGARCAVLSSSRRRHSAGSRRTDDLIQSATQHLLMRSTCAEQRAS